MPETFEKYRLLLKATSDAVYDYNLLTHQIDWNENLSLFGYQTADVEPGIEWWAQRVHPEDRESTLAMLDASIRGDLGHFKTTYRFRCADGRYRMVSDRGYIVKDSTGQAVRLIGVMQDVHIYQQIFEHSPQPMWIFDCETLRFLAVNEMAIRLYGYSRPEFLSMSLTEIRPPEDVPLLRAAIDNPDREHEGNTIWRHFTKAGKLLHVEVHTQDLDFSGTPARMSLITDVSRRIVVEQQLRESQKLEAIGQLASGIAHVFDNLLTIIQEHAKRLLAAESPSRADIEAIDLASASAQGFTQQLLAFARQQAHRSERLVWSEAIAAAEPLLRKLVPPRIGIQFRTHTEQAHVEVDHHQLVQILLNLITNARDAIQGGGQITVTSAAVNVGPDHPDCRPGSPHGSFIQLTVADSGTGMSEAVKSHLFEPFFTTKAEGQGTGLGLSTVYGIVNQNKGWIRVDSEPGLGSEFRIYLPTS